MLEQNFLKWEILMVEGIRNRQLESINSMAVFLVQGPGDGLVQGLDGGLGLLGNVSHDQVDSFALVVSLLALDHIFWGHTSL